ncbi:MAG: chorismate-binding protein, partial [Betaproteobacteria bacterium]|nr:chorismate-binding protein [Betaproteobacteria bacterium]
MTEAEFNQLAAAGYNRIPLVLETFADLDTPLSAYLKLANHPFTYLLESVVGGERFGRYSFIGLAADARIEVRGHRVAEFQHNALVNQGEIADPLDFVRSYHQRFKAVLLPGLPRFCGGLVGYFGYDTVRYIERKLAADAKPDPIGAPDILLLASAELAVFDNLSGKLYLVVYADPREADAYQRGRERLKALLTALRRPVEIPGETPGAPQPAQSEFSEDAYLDVVERAKRYIYDGDIMQVVLSQRMSHPFTASPLALYRALRALNPSPYMFFFNF